MRWLGGISNSMDTSLSKFRDIVDREAWRDAVYVVTEGWTRFSDRTTTT